MTIWQAGGHNFTKEHKLTCSHRSDDINDGSLVCPVLVLCPGLVRHQRPDLVQINSRTMVLVAGQMKVPHSNFTKVARMAGSEHIPYEQDNTVMFNLLQFVEVDPVMMLPSSVSTTTRMLTMLTCKHTHT